MRTTRLIVALLLLTIASSSGAAKLGPPRRVAALGKGPAEARLGAVLPFGDGQVAFSLQREQSDPTRRDIVATPIDRLGVPQYDLARAIVSGAQSVPLAARTSDGYLLCWVFEHEIYTLALSSSLSLKSTSANAVLQENTPVDLVCNGSHCLLTTTTSGTTAGSSASILLLGSDGIPDSASPDQAVASHSSITAVNGGFAFADGRGVIWTDSAGRITGKTTVPNPSAFNFNTLVVPCSAGVLVVASSSDAVRTWTVSQTEGVLKTASYALPKSSHGNTPEIPLVAASGNGTTFVVAAYTNYAGVHDGDPEPLGVSAFIINADLDLVRPWFEIEDASFLFEPVLSVSSNGPDFLMGWNGSAGRVLRVMPDVSVEANQGLPLAIGPVGQQALGLAASPDSTLPVWRDVGQYAPPTKIERIQAAGNGLDVTPLPIDTNSVQPVWDGQTFAIFGSLSATPKDFIGGSIDASGSLHTSLIRHDTSLLNVWWDGSAYVAATGSWGSARDYHLLRIAPDMTVLSDIPLSASLRAAAGLPGRTLIVTDPPAVTILDDRGSIITTFPIVAPANTETYFQINVASNGRDQFLLVTVANGIARASRLTPDGRLLDDMTMPVLQQADPYSTRGEAFGNRWIIFTPHVAIEYPSLQPIDLTGAGPIAAAARASSNRIVFLTTETTSVNGLLFNVLMLHDLIDDTQRHRAVR